MSKIIFVNQDIAISELGHSNNNIILFWYFDGIGLI